MSDKLGVVLLDGGNEVGDTITLSEFKRRLGCLREGDVLKVVKMDK